MAIVFKSKNFADLHNQQKARHFYERGIERTARAELGVGCEFLCNERIMENDAYYDINGEKYAHKSCVQELEQWQKQHQAKAV